MMTVHVGWVLHRPTLPEVSLHSRLLSLAPPKIGTGIRIRPSGTSSPEGHCTSFLDQCQGSPIVPTEVKDSASVPGVWYRSIYVPPFPQVHHGGPFPPRATQHDSPHTIEQSRGNGRSIIVKADRQLVHYFFPPRATGMTSEGNNGRWPKSCREHKENKN